MTRDIAQEPTTSQKNWSLIGISILFALAPIGFGVIRAVRTGNDFRYLWVALASLVSAAIVFAVGADEVDGRACRGIRTLERRSEVRFPLVS
jgi:hypothetical protein